MMETQETNLPMNEAITVEETGELEEANQLISVPVEEEVSEIETVALPEEESETVEPVALPEEESETVEPVALPEEESETVEVITLSIEAPASAPAPEKEVEAVVAPALTRSEIIARLELVVDEPQKYAREEVESLKNAYNRLRRADNEERKRIFMEGGGEEKDFSSPEEEQEARLNVLISEYREKRRRLDAEEARQKESNLILRQHLVERLKLLTESQDDFYKRQNEFREVQTKWREIKTMPQEFQKDLWRTYQIYGERFYDLIKINNQLREYDYKKNLEMKTALCEAVERLVNEKDIIGASRQAQKLFLQWKEIGPVSKLHRTSIWDRFKDASNAIGKLYQSYVSEAREKEDANHVEKINLCKKIESIDFSAMKTIHDWDKQTNEVLDMQKKWHTIGYVAKNQNSRLFSRFRTACDAYFDRKNEFYKSSRSEMDRNLEMKKALIDKAEEWKESSDWSEATRVYIDIQGQWKKIGITPYKQADLIWQQFTAACDYFFERKKQENSSHSSEEAENLIKKQALIDKIKEIDENRGDEASLAILKGYIAEWNNIGYVPFKEKENLHNEFHKATDKLFDRLKMSDRDRRMQQFRSNLEVSGSGKNKLLDDRDKLIRIYDSKRGELQTYENNIGFLTIASKSGTGLKKEMDRKINRLKEEIEVVVKKIEAIDEKLD